MRPIWAVLLFVGGLAAFGSAVHYFGEIEPAEFWRIAEEHPVVYESNMGIMWGITADAKVTRHEMAIVHRLVDSHDHSHCLARSTSRHVE